MNDCKKELKLTEKTVSKLVFLQQRVAQMYFIKYLQCQHVYVVTSFLFQVNNELNLIAKFSASK